MTEKANSLPTAKRSRSLSLTLTAMFIVLTYVFTLIGVNITGLMGGYIHLGNIPIFVALLLFGKRIGIVSAGVGMALFDLMSPYVAWAPFTFVIGLAMAFVMGLILEKSQSPAFYCLAVFLGILVKITGYYFAEVFLYGNWIIPFSSIPANVLQVLLAALVVPIIIKPLRVATERMRLDRK